MLASTAALSPMSADAIAEAMDKPTDMINARLNPCMNDGPIKFGKNEWPVIFETVCFGNVVSSW